MPKRRSFLKMSGLAGAALFADLMNPVEASANLARLDPSNRPSASRFNMSGFAAPKLDRVRIGFVGLGNRGPAAVDRMSYIDGVDIKALCDIRPEKLDAMVKKLQGKPHSPKTYTGNEECWKQLCENPDLDLVYIATPWALHTPIAVYALNHGKHVCVEVPAAKTIEQCWQLVEASEKNKKHCMMLENCCYDFFELLTLNLVRQGMLGDVLHGEGAYLHNLLGKLFAKDAYYKFWRLTENLRNGNLYPTHGLGPVAQLMNINRGDRMEMLSSTQSNDYSLQKHADELAAKDQTYAPWKGKKFRGNMNSTGIRTVNGRSILLQHDVSSPNIYSRIFKVTGTKGTVLKYPLPGRISFDQEDWISADEYKKIEDTYAPPIVKKLGDLAKEVGGHGGMDFLMDWRTIDCLRNGLPLDMDVYDAAAWSSIGPLSEWSVANGSKPIAIPDFTNGNWKTNTPVDTSLNKGGTTGVLK